MHCWCGGGIGVADVIYFAVTAATGIEPDVSAGDVFWILSYVLLIIAVLGRDQRRDRWWRLDVDGLIDLCAAAVVVLLAMSQVADLGALFSDDTVPVEVRAVWAAYPVLDAVLMAVVTRDAVGRRRPDRRTALLFVGIGSWLLADFAFMLGATASSTRWLDAGWMLGAYLIAGAAIVGDGTDVAPERDVGPVRRARVALTLVPLLLPSAVMVAAHVRGRDVNPLPLALASAVLVGCGVLRGWRLIKARDEQQRLVLAREHYNRILTDISTDAVIVITARGVITHHSARLDDMLGIDARPQSTDDLLSLLEPGERERITAVVTRLLLTPDARAEAEVEVVRADSTPCWLELRFANLTHDPIIAGVVINATDITRRKEVEHELLHLAFHDTLTGLPNRALFHDRLEHALRRAARTGHDLAVIFLDVDGFKAANDHYGHDAGDRLLQQVAERLGAAVRTTDTLARLGGDEFAILVEGAGHPLDEACTVADRALQAISEPLEIAGNQFTLSASIGIAVGDADSTTATLIRDADVAMYQSKANGKAQWTVYDSTMRTAAAERLQLELDLIAVLPDRQLRLVYQPILRLETETIVGFEALVRWEHPTRGTISPDQFIPIAEANGMILPIGKWVLDEACRTAAGWRHEAPSANLTIAVNLSARQLADPNIVAHVADALHDSRLPAGALVLEMTETVLVDDPDTAAARLQQLRELGVKLAIDDFGTGYSSLSYLRQFPVDILKIDRSFIASITDRAKVPAIVRGLLDLGRTLELETIAEGIELAEQLTTLRDEACHYGQGFLFAKPVPADDAARLIAQLADAPTRARPHEPSH